MSCVTLECTCTHLRVRCVSFRPYIQAGEPQERKLQLPSHHPQQENPPNPTENVVGERRELPRAPSLHSLDSAQTMGRPLPSEDHPSCHRTGLPVAHRAHFILY